MADEKLEVVVQQEVGVINWNFEQLKAAVADKMKEYEVKEYTEETVPAAKADVATLRKLKKSVSDKRIEIKKKCLEPYEVIEAQAAELTELLDKPIDKIAGQLDEYETKRRAAIKEKVLAYMDEVFKGLPLDVANKLKEKTYDPKFENVSTATKTWKQYVNDAEKRTMRDLEALNDPNICEPEFYDGAVAEYSKNLVLNEAMAKIAELRKQKEIILAKERERIAAEERAKAEAEVRAKLEEEKKETQTPPNNEPEGGKSGQNTGEGVTVRPQPQNTAHEPSTKSEDGEPQIYTLRIRATNNQIARIKGFIEYSGAAYREV